MLKNIFKLLFVVSFIFHTANLKASTYDHDILEIFSKTLPHFIFMNKQNKQLKNRIKICIVHEKIDQDAALSLIRKIHTNYPDGLDSYPLELVHTDFLHVNLCQESQLIFVMNAPREKIIRVVQYAKSQHALTASYDNALLADGIELSLFLGRRIVPYINVDALKDNGIELDNLWLRISKIYIKMDQ